MILSIAMATVAVVTILIVKLVRGAVGGGAKVSCPLIIKLNLGV